MAGKTQPKNAEVKEARRARQRYMDQPGQWVDTTPASVKKRQQAEFKKFQAMMKKSGK